MPKSPTGQARLDLAATRYLFAFICRDLKSFLAARPRIDSSAFDKRETAYRIIWEQTVLHYNRWKQLPKLSELKSAIIAYLDETGEDDDFVEDDLQDVLDLMPSITKSVKVKRRESILRDLRLFLDAVVARQVASELQEGGDVRKVIEAGRHSAITNTTVQEGANKDWFASTDLTMKASKIEVFPTGQKLIDELLNGGLRGGEVLLHMGAINSGKTTLAVDVSVSRAMYEYRQATKQKRKPRKVYFYSYEESQQVFAQVMARAANIQTSSIEEWLLEQSKSVLSTKEKGNYKAYEKRWRRISGQKLDGELERLEKAFAIMRQVFQFVVMSSEDPNNVEYSYQGVTGLVEHFDSHVITSDHKPDLLVLDHASALVERYYGEITGKKDERRNVLKKLALDLKDKLAAPYKIPVWCVHQLGPEENKRPPGTVPEVTSGSECRMMHEFFSFCIQSSRLTDDDKIGVVALGKQRRMKGADSIPFRLDGGLCRWKDARSTHTIHSGRVRKIEDVAPVASKANDVFTPGRRI